VKRRVSAAPLPMECINAIHSAAKFVILVFVVVHFPHFVRILGLTFNWFFVVCNGGE
jgi:hypothetical protein